jgi:hypothetical protein
MNLDPSSVRLWLKLLAALLAVVVTLMEFRR